MLDRFFTMSAIERNGDSYQAVLTLNPDHEVFLGHFPGEPVVPGVCTMQMVKHVAEQSLGRKLRLMSFSGVKYTKLLDPRVSPELRVMVTLAEREEGWMLNAEAFVGDEQALKVKNAVVVAEP